MRYAETIDCRDYEPKIKKLLDTHIRANEVMQLNEPVNIFDDKMFNQIKEEQGIYQTKKTTGSKADTIAHATKKVITEKMFEDPAFYETFSKLIQQAIDDFRVKRISDLDYFWILKPFMEKHDLKEIVIQTIAADTAIAIHNILEKHKKVHFWDDDDAQKQALNEIDDYLYDELKTEKGIELSLDQMDSIIEKVLQVAKHRSYQ